MLFRSLGLLASIPRIEDDDNERLTTIRGTVPNPLHLPSGCPFSDRCDRCTERCRQEMPQLKPVPGTNRMCRCFVVEDEVKDNA